MFRNECGSKFMCLRSRLTQILRLLYTGSALGDGIHPFRERDGSQEELVTGQIKPKTIIRKVSSAFFFRASSWWFIQTVSFLLSWCLVSRRYSSHEKIKNVFRLRPLFLPPCTLCWENELPIWKRGNRYRGAAF